MVMQFIGKIAEVAEKVAEQGAKVSPEKASVQIMPENADVKTSPEKIETKISPERTEANLMPTELSERTEARQMPKELGESESHESTSLQRPEIAIEPRIDENIQDGGGSYKAVCSFRNETGQEGKEVHHMPADSASDIRRSDGPCILMDDADHRQTASCGSSREAQQYRAEQRNLIDEGNFRDALQMDIDDIKDNFGDKYDAQIKEMLEYVNKLEQGGYI